MALTLENEFVVQAGVEPTWAMLLDLSRVASCLPGAEIEPPTEQGEYHGTMKVRLGPVSMTYKGVARLTHVDEASRTASFNVQGKETKGQGTASATISNHLSERPEGTHVRVVTELSITGRPAQFGRGIMQDVASRMLADFAACLSARISEPAPAADGAAGADGGAAPASAPADSPPAPQEAAEVLDLSGVVGGVMARRVWRAAGLAALTAAVAAVFRRRRARRRR